MRTLCDVRHACYLSQEALARAADIPVAAIEAIEQHRLSPTASRQRALARALGVRPCDITWPTIPPAMPDRDCQEAEPREATISGQ